LFGSTFDGSKVFYISAKEMIHTGEKPYANIERKD
jgi:hypothetical protein